VKIAVVSESPADEAAIRILVDAIVGVESELVSLRTRPNGWTRIFDLLPNIISGLYYGQPDVDGLVIVMDSDETPPHQNAHESPHESHPDCRLCQLRVRVRDALSKLKPLANRPNLKVALGLAVPAIEAWYRAGIDGHVMEAAWSRRLSGEDVSYDKRSLKRDAYGSHQPGLEMKIKAATASAQRLRENLELLEQLFPNGFGSLLRDLQGW
jgi:hypothetical protein